jgi:geranylgeranyl pyrophosphate synthase
MTASVGLDDGLSSTRDWVEDELERRLAASRETPERLAEALRYALLGGGKRLRPALVRLACRELGGRDEDALAPAAAVEMLHTYSLVHDDLPCMDDDDLRRGRPTCHRVFGEAVAVLVGDALQCLAFEALADCGPRCRDMVAVLARGAGPEGMVGGQALDLEAEGLDHGGEDRVRRIHERKTAALIAASLELGALAADPTPEQRRAMRAFGQSLGLCFQAVDDLLDVTGDAAALGKTPGKDARARKATLVSALGLEGARREAERLAREALDAARAAGCAADGLVAALIHRVLERRR